MRCLLCLLYFLYFLYFLCLLCFLCLRFRLASETLPARSAFYPKAGTISPTHETE